MNRLIESLLLNLKRINNRRTVYFIHNNDLEKILQDCNVYDDILAGKVFCPNCNNSITLSNISSIKKHNDGLIIFCNSATCRNEVSISYIGDRDDR